MNSIPPLKNNRLQEMIDQALEHPQVPEQPDWKHRLLITGLPTLAASLLLLWLLLPASAPLKSADYAEVSDLLLLELVEEL